MAMARTTLRRPKRGPRVQREISKRTKVALGIGTAGIVLIVVAVWLFDILTAPPKPVVQTSSPQQVAEFLGHPRGFSRMSVEDRRTFLIDCVQRYQTPEEAAKLSEEIRRLSFTERQGFLDATFEVVKVGFVEASDQYKQTPAQQKKAFVDKVLQTFGTLRGQIGGPDFNAPTNLANPFREHVPEKSDQWTKMILARTTPSERAKVKPLIDDMAERVNELKRTRGGRGS